jgi:hypothetical protein
LAVVAGLWCIVFVFNLTKPLPQGVSVAGPPRDAAGMEFLVDLTYQTPGGEVVQQEIFDRVLAMIDGAEEFVVMDMFLFNDLHSGDREYRPITEELTRHLIARKTERPGLVATFITDEINNFYGAYTAPHLAAMEDAGIQVVTTNMMRLRDSNPAYSAVWRMALGWFGTGGPGWLSNIFGPQGPRVTVRGLLKLLNMKANHRKLIVTDRECLVASANPHDASSFHSNIAFAGAGPVCADLLEGERAVAAFSGGDVSGWPTYRASDGGVDANQESVGGPMAPEGTAVAQAGTVQLLTEGKILEGFLADVGGAGPGDRVDVAMFYMAERQVVNALLEADTRGAEVRLVLDPNKDAFGREKGGIPNRQVARELNTVLAITGAVDLVTDGNRVLRVENGHPLLTRVTGTGCTATAVIGAFLAVDADPLAAAAGALAFFGIAAERAAEHVETPGGYKSALIDALYALDPDSLRSEAHIHETTV